MEPEKCKTGFIPDIKYGYRITVEGDCSKLLNDIKENLGEYGRRYLEDRIVYVQNEPSSPGETQPLPPESQSQS